MGNKIEINKFDKSSLNNIRFALNNRKSAHQKQMSMS